MIDMVRSRLALIMLALALATVAGTACAERQVVDMAGRSVSVADHVRKVVTLGPVPVINSFVFAFGEAGTILNGLPPNFRTSPRWEYQDVFAPGLSAKPPLQTSEGGPMTEEILGLGPDVVLTMNRESVAVLERIGVPTLYLSWRAPDDVKRVMALLGELFGKPAKAEAYGTYFDGMIRRVEAHTATLPPESRPRVLYCTLARLTQPHLIAEWWIAKAGGRSVTDDGRASESTTFSLEQLLAWDPEVLILGNPREIADAYADPRLQSLSAVRQRRVVAAPNGAHLWANRTVEQPLMVLWAARQFFPTLVTAAEVDGAVADFYATFFGTTLPPDRIADILAGTPRP